MNHEHHEHHDMDMPEPSVQTTRTTAATPRPTERAEGATSFRPSVDVCDCGAEVRIVADVPGCHTDAIDVSFEDGVLAIAAAVPARPLPGRLLVQEYGVGDYRRSFRLGEGFDAAQITAALARGVLTVRVPRLAAVRPRKVEVRVG